MSSWRRQLREFLSSAPVGDYTYDEFAIWLHNLDFERMGKSGSHRTWRRALPSGIVLRITLVKSGHGPVKAVYTKKLHELLNSSEELKKEIFGDEHKS